MNPTTSISSLWLTFLGVCLGGAFGSALRYMVSLWLPRMLGSGFPYATLCVNLIGCFLIGLLTPLSLQTHQLSPFWRVSLTTGLLGGLTTYSGFSHETVLLLLQGSWRKAVLNILLTFGLGLLSGWVGLVWGQAIIGSRS